MRTLALAWILCALCSVAQAQLVVGNDQSGVATIYEVNVITGVATPLYSASDSSAKPWGMAYDGTTNTLYWNNGSVLFSSPFGTPLTPTNLGTMSYGAGTINFVALSFYNGKLYGTRNIATEAVYEIDPATLQATLVYQYSSSFDFGGLEHDVATGKLYGLSDTAPAGEVRGLYELDIAAQTTTFLAPYPAGETDIDGLAVYNRIAYYVTDGPNNVQAFFYVYDVGTGALLGTLPSPFTGSGTFSAATFIARPVTSCPGDSNGDTLVNFADISPFIAAIKAGSATNWTCDLAAGLGPYRNSDANGDGTVNFADISPFISLLKNPPPQCSSTCP
ncbi:MAG: hypothetical protein IPM18_07205 [Phycisphaerales bacterium]|nr:hypothetical protein [Phycisphaerales bacterium]